MEHCKRLGAEIAFCDYGYKGSRERYFQEALGNDMVFLVDHRTQANHLVTQDWSIIDPRDFGTERIISIPKALAWGNLITLMSASDPILRIPWAEPARFVRYLEHLHNIYRPSSEERRSSEDEYEPVIDERERFVKRGPIHIADCFKFMGLFFIQPNYTQYFLALAKTKRARRG